MNPNLSKSLQLLSYLKGKGLKMAFVSPGARSLPLVVALQKSSFEMISVIDERAAAYAAIGYAQATALPAALVCTSGTAVANYYPAVIEAYQSALPLIVLSADRPSHLIGSGANQTIDQNEIFGIYAHYLDIPETMPAGDRLERFLDLKLSRTILSKRVLHCNLRFDEPLIRADKQQEAGLAVNDHVRQRCKFPSSDGIHQLSKTLIVAGCLMTSEIALFSEWVRKAKSPKILDISSGLSHLNDPYRLPSFEDPATSRWLKTNKPNCILHIGGSVVSKAYVQYLETFSGQALRLNTSSGVFDPAYCFDSIATLDTLPFLEIEPWHTEILCPSDGFLQECKKLSTATVCAEVLQLPQAVLLGNSGVVRAADLIRTNAAKRIYLHRGASGIEGFFASASGICRAQGAPLTLVLGDVAALHDLSSIALLADLPLTVVICNNQGGAIFDRTEAANAQEVFQQFIRTRHQLNFENAAAMFGMKYHMVTTRQDLAKALSQNWQGQPQIIECQIGPDADQEFWHQLSLWRQT